MEEESREAGRWRKTGRGGGGVGVLEEEEEVRVERTWQEAEARQWPEAGTRDGD